jgi:hypothetical protein
VITDLPRRTPSLDDRQLEPVITLGLERSQLWRALEDDVDLDGTQAARMDSSTDALEP